MIGAIINVIAQVIDNLSSGKKLTDGLIIAIVSGVVTGGLAASGAGKIIQALVSAAVAGASEYLTQVKAVGRKNVKFSKVIISTLLAGIAGYWGGDGTWNKKSDVSKAKKIYDYAIKGIKNRKWNGVKGGKYLTLSANRLHKELVKSLNKTTFRYSVGTFSVTFIKRYL